tara:strand:+ start:162 stop:347 length:186 start_codon:yes stop_codon:yes gene_type:complete
MDNNINYCVLEDCNKEECHHCFPVKGCQMHQICIERGIFEDMNIILKNKHSKNNNDNKKLK